MAQKWETTIKWLKAKNAKGGKLENTKIERFWKTTKICKIKSDKVCKDLGNNVQSHQQIWKFGKCEFLPLAAHSSGRRLMKLGQNKIKNHSLRKEVRSYKKHWMTWWSTLYWKKNFLSALFSMKTATKRMESDPNWYKVIFKTGKKLSQMLFGAPPKQIMRNISDYMDRNPYNHIIIFQWYIYNCSCMYGSKIFLGPPWGGKYNLGHGQQ